MWRESAIGSAVHIHQSSVMLCDRITDARRRVMQWVYQFHFSYYFFSHFSFRFVRKLLVSIDFGPSVVRRRPMKKQ